ncbi:MAG: phenylacetate--CoA ligase family protein [Candidatus Abyssobacteria bacterium SURF_17]|jgi:phenylacetate-CoA ligase|uniref:Phenylacetate-coenzyme A ligase n=1 Tax=Candidatus Abyssobacteria bacterium SURF_17 TaxID=2093361 RepID=A0A419F6S8_9BACT|nr:MAG: phenylacetate--CoA ligase family protein [Candidatus Abyssubacteria bacterium SURF_17]
MIWDRQHECMSRKRLRELQLTRLKSVVRRVYKNVPYFRSKLDALGLKPAKIKSLDDLRKLPFITKHELRETYPFGLFATPMKDIVRIHSSSGTTGKPVVAGYTRSDLNLWAELMARTMTAGGTTADDVVQNAYGYGLFTGGLGIHYGAEKIGATVVPISGGNTARQLMVMEDFGVTVLACTPSYSLQIAEVAEEKGMDMRKMKLRVGIFGAEPWSEEMRKEIEERLRIRALDIYGLTEIIGPGVASECEHRCGLHIFEDHFLPEIIDPDTGEALPEGQRGELVITCLTKKAFPVIRFRTRDITRLHHEKCDCGRTFARMERVTGRTDDMLIIRGVNVFPSQIESVLVGIEEAEPHYQLIVRKDGPMDTLEVQVEVDQRLFSDEIKKLQNVERKVAHEINSLLGIHAKVTLVQPKTIERSMGKAKRVIDMRKEG